MYCVCYQHTKTGIRNYEEKTRITLKVLEEQVTFTSHASLLHTIFYCVICGPLSTLLVLWYYTHVWLLGFIDCLFWETFHNYARKQLPSHVSITAMYLNCRKNINHLNDLTVMIHRKYIKCSINSIFAFYAYLDNWKFSKV